MAFFSAGDSGTPSLFVQACVSFWYDWFVLRLAFFASLREAGVVKIFRWAVVQSMDFSDFLKTLHSLQREGVRIGFPDTFAPVALADAHQLSAAVDDAIFAFQKLRGGHTIVNANDNSYRETVSMRVKQLAKGDSRQNGVVESQVSEQMAKLRALLVREQGKLGYWGGNNFFSIEIPLSDLNSLREFRPDTEGLSWNEQYELKLARASWASLRSEAFRNCNQAAMVAERFDSSSVPTVYIPSVGICVHPWIFADRGFQVIASDISSAAIQTVSQPHNFPRIYSRQSYDRWDISAICTWGYDTEGFHPEYFSGMPDLGSTDQYASLANRISFSCCDWADVPVPDGSVDLIFAVNALPRTSNDDLERVLADWIRALRSGGCIFIAQHHPDHGVDLDSFFQGCGLIPCSIRKGRFPSTGSGGYQLYFSSG